MERGDRGVAGRGPGGGASKTTGVSIEGGWHKGSFPSTGRVPEELLRECERNRQTALVGAARKATNLYRRVSTVSYSSGGRCSRAKAQRVGKRCGGAKCLACLVTLVKSSKDRRRAGVKLSCPCDVRVCDTCIANDPEWYLSEPHFSSCSVVREFECARCACFAVLMNKPCCAWMCSRCSADLRESGSSCSRCSAPVSRGEPRERRSLCCDTRSACDSTSGAPCCDERKLAEYREEIRARVVERVSSSRHVSTSDLEALFPECPGTRAVCSCESKDRPNPMCPRCTPVLAVMELLARNPNPLMASFAERAVPGRALARNVYSRALLAAMLNDPTCLRASTLIRAKDAGERQDRAVEISGDAEAYKRLVADRERASRHGERLRGRRAPPHCILCLLFNQSAAVAQMCSSHGLRLEPHPRSCSELTAEFPGMDFGKLTMNKGELKIALRDQLCLHSKFDASLGLQALSSRCCEEAIDRYRDHRLAAAGWFLDVTGSEAPRARSQRRHHPVVLPAVNAMDRYAATCESEAKLLGMLRNVANVRAACFSLSVKMYGV
ncbi:hypothetical protein Q5P01_021951 [Channa striata]|uniref:Uncharacterized protein n=1 Tax=Channa striata TaxID=64152 RepID=A0AA88IYS1_CHASR|nr:hypothetical protein Q5P01_021951 [Channa striata]